MRPGSSFASGSGCGCSFAVAGSPDGNTIGTGRWRGERQPLPIVARLSEALECPAAAGSASGRCPSRPVGPFQAGQRGTSCLIAADQRTLVCGPSHFKFRRCRARCPRKYGPPCRSARSWSASPEIFSGGSSKGRSRTASCRHCIVYRTALAVHGQHLKNVCRVLSFLAADGTRCFQSKWTRRMNFAAHRKNQGGIR